MHRDRHAAVTRRPPASRLGERVRALRVVCRPHADRARRRALLEGVHQPDRARQDPPDRVDDRLARRAARRRSGVPLVRRLDRGAREGRGAARLAPRRSRRRISTRRRSRRIARRAPSVDAHRRAVARASGALRRGVGAPGGRARCDEAIELLQRARELAERAEFSDVERADVLFRLAVCRYKLSSISTAIALFDEALALAERSGLPCDLLRSDILQRRSRCHRRLRDYVAAHDDVERALELAQDIGDRAAIANAYFQASLVAQRQGHYVLVAQLRAACEGAVPAAERRAQRRSAAAHARRPHAPPGRRGATPSST